MTGTVISHEQRRFLASHRLCIVATGRQSGPPALSPVFYVLDGDEILISLTTNRHKYRAVQRDPRLSLCVLHEEFPFSYLTVYGRAVIEPATAADTMAAVSEAIFGRPLTGEERADIGRRVTEEGRITLRVKPERVVDLGPPRPSANT